MTISKIRVGGTDHDLRAKYLETTPSSEAKSVEFYTRTTTEDATVATIQKIYGNTIKWNQLVNNGNFATTTGWAANKGTIAVSNNVLTFTASSPNSNCTIYRADASIVSGHKYLFSFYVTCSKAITVRGSVGSDNGNNQSVTASTRTHYSQIITSTAASQYAYCYLNRNSALSNGDTVLVENVNVFDLTEIYGSGNEPSVSDFEAQYPDPYYAYFPRNLSSLRATSIQTVGFNKWDEQWESGKELNLTTGAVQSSSTNSVSKNYIPVKPNTEYYYINGTWSRRRIVYYGSNKAYLSSLSVNSNGAFTTPADCYYIKFYWLGLTYNNDICINISDSSKNGTYEPYQGHQLSLNITSLTGKLNGVGSSTTVFSNGMQSNGSTRDETDGNVAIKRIADDNTVLSTAQSYVLDDTIQKQYFVETGGTESIVPSDPSLSAPIKMDVIYGNAADTISNLPANYISVDSMKDFLSALGTQMGGTWSMQFQDGKYTFTFTSS